VWFEENSTFRGNVSLSSSSEKINPNKKPAARLPLLVFAWLILWPWRCRRYVPPKRRTFSEVHGVASQKTVLYLVTHVGTSDQICLCFYVVRGLRSYFENSPFILAYSVIVFVLFVPLFMWTEQADGAVMFSVRISVQTLAILTEGFPQPLQVNAGPVSRFSKPQLNYYYYYYYYYYYERNWIIIIIIMGIVSLYVPTKVVRDFSVFNVSKCEARSFRQVCQRYQYHMSLSCFNWSTVSLKDTFPVHNSG
jgi:hypothetical protein